MASIRQREGSWIADIRRKGHKSISKSFKTKGQAQAWAREVESKIDAMEFSDDRGLALITLSQLIERYNDEIGATKEFGRNKVAVITSLDKLLGSLSLKAITADRLVEHIKSRLANGAGGVTIGVELSYLGSIYKAAKQLWKIPVDLDVISNARGNMRYMGLSTKSKERDRRPTQKEIDDICLHFTTNVRQRVPMEDLILFAIATAMRAGEIIGLKWADLNEADKTIIIRNRKHPQEKQGNDQTVPLLGDAFDIVKRQPRTDDRIFPIADGTISSLFPRACNKLGIVDLRFHDLRHEGVSRLFEQGYRIEQVALVSGHRDWKMLARYTQIRAKDLHRV